MARRILVLGGSGFVGMHVCARLVAAGDWVTVPTRRRARARDLLPLPTVNVVEADIHDPKALAERLVGTDAVINLVGILHEDGAQTFAAAHVDLTAKVIAACRAAGVARLLHVSALGASPDGPSRYLESKGKAERLVEASGLAWTIFRPSVIYGRDDSFLGLFAKLVRSLPVIALAAPNAKFQPVYVGDVAHCVAQSVADDRTIGQRYDLAGPRVYTLRELITFVMETTGHVRPVIPLGPALSSLQARVLELAPGRLMTRDNLASMQVDNVAPGPFPAVFGIQPVALESVAPGWLAPTAMHSRFDEFRAQSGR